MIKLRTIVIILLLYIISFVSIRYNFNFLYPYYYFKDLLLYPVKALVKDNSLNLSDDTLKSMLNTLQQDKEELMQLLNLQNSLSNYQTINATIISRNKEYWFNTLTIDKGKVDGIKEDASVLGVGGLIGRISNVREYTSDVKLITTNDANNKISIVIPGKDKDYYGVMSGYDSTKNLLKVTMFEENNIEDNLKVETTGMGGVFPKGLLIGYVFDTYKDLDDVTFIVRVRPSSKIEGAKYVSVIQREEISHT